MEVSGQLHAPAALPLENDSASPVRRPYGTESHSGLCGKEKNPLTVVSNLNSSAFNYFGQNHSDWAVIMNGD
jgi:hypothetical protein